MQWGFEYTLPFQPPVTGSIENPVSHPERQHKHDQKVKQAGLAYDEEMIAPGVEKKWHQEDNCQPGYLKDSLVNTGADILLFHGAAIIDLLGVDVSRMARFFASLRMTKKGRWRRQRDLNLSDTVVKRGEAPLGYSTFFPLLAKKRGTKGVRLSYQTSTNFLCPAH